jgi:hypothetical protein
MAFAHRSGLCIFRGAVPCFVSKEIPIPGAVPGGRSAGYRANDPRRSAGEPALVSVWLELLLNRDPRRIRTHHLVPSCFAMASSTAQSRSQQRNGPGVVAAPKVMKGGRHLNERLQEFLFRLACREPNRFPVLVCFEVRAGIKAVQTLP